MADYRTEYITMEDMALTWLREQIRHHEKELRYFAAWLEAAERGVKFDGSD